MQFMFMNFFNFIPEDVFLWRNYKYFWLFISELLNIIEGLYVGEKYKLLIKIKNNDWAIGNIYLN